MTSSLPSDFLDEALRSLPSRGRPGVPPKMERALSRDDLALLAGKTPKQETETSLSKIREGHHAMARLVAQGESNVAVAAFTGYTPQRVSDLKRDPAFCELVAFYKGQINAQFINVHERLATVGLTATQILQEKLETEGPDLSVGELTDVIKSTMDRAGYGPQSTKNLNVGVGLAPEVLAAIKADAGRGAVRQLHDVVDAKFEALPSPTCDGIVVPEGEPS